MSSRRGCTVGCTLVPPVTPAPMLGRSGLLERQPHGFPTWGSSRLSPGVRTGWALGLESSSRKGSLDMVGGVVGTILLFVPVTWVTHPRVPRCKPASCAWPFLTRPWTSLPPRLLRAGGLQRGGSKQSGFQTAGRTCACSTHRSVPSACPTPEHGQEQLGAASPHVGARRGGLCAQGARASQETSQPP